jgi:membrane protease YdiL (CAAX protease family)
LGWIVRRTGRLKTAVIAHIVFNSAFIPLGMIPGIESLMENPAGLTLYLFLPSIAVTLIAIRLFDSATSKKQDQM